VLFSTDMKLYEDEAQFSASADGELFVINRLVESAAEGPLVVHTEWRGRFGG
jgi:hypothetical protein